MIQVRNECQKGAVLHGHSLRTHRWPHPGDIWPWWLARWRKGMKLLGDSVPWMSRNSQSCTHPNLPAFPLELLWSCFSGAQLLWFSGQFSRNQISRSQCISLTGGFFKSAINLDKCGVYRSLNFCQKKNKTCGIWLLALGSNPGSAYYILTLDKFLSLIYKQGIKSACLSEFLWSKCEKFEKVEKCVDVIVNI